MTNQINNQSIIPSTDVIQLTLTVQAVETAVTINNNSPIQDYVHLDDQIQPTFEMSPGFKSFTVYIVSWSRGSLQIKPSGSGDENGPYLSSTLQGSYISKAFYSLRNDLEISKLSYFIRGSRM